MIPMRAATRISLGLVCSMIGILMLAHFLGLLPDRDQGILQQRVHMVESLGISASAMVAADDIEGLATVLETVVNRHTDLQSAALRSMDEDIRIEAGRHFDAWPQNLQGISSDRYMQVPLYRIDESQWGTLEFRYAPLNPEGLAGLLQTQFFGLMLFCTAFAFAVFYTFLCFVLKNLDPSRAVPRRVREALDILAEGLMIIGNNGRVLLANQALAGMTGHDAERIIGTDSAALGFVPEDSSSQLPWMQALQQEKNCANVTMTRRASGGVTRIFNVNCSPLRGNAGQYRGVMVTFDDITQLQQNKAELRAAKEDAEAANKAKTEFLANMSHEIRNPMNAIVGFTDILRRGLEDGPETRTEYLNTIHASGTHLVGLINDILDLSKIEAGRMELEIRECSPWQILSEVVAVMQGKASEKHLTLESEVRGQIPQVIQSDPTRLRQILMNLISNAIRFTQEGSVRIFASLTLSGGQPVIRFDVQDTGIGMTPDQCGRVFEQFVQADSSVTRRFGGTGLGLAISKRLTEALGGTITVDSQLGIGTTFSVCVAAGDLTGVEMMNSVQAARSLRSEQQQQTELQYWFQPARVLVTDDTPANRKLVGLVLEKAGLTVDEAENGQQATEMVPRGNYDLVLMDMQMPVMDGFTATTELRRAGVNIPIVALTANVISSAREKCEQAGCSGFLTKPIDIDQLLAALAELLPTGEQPAAALSESPDTADTPPKQETPADRTPSPSPPESDTDDGITAIYSTLPTDIPEFGALVGQFVDGLNGLMNNMRQAWQARDYETLSSLGHKLKGTGGTIGFPAFTEPAARLEHLAEQQVEDEIEELLQELEDLSLVVRKPETEAIGCGH